jgi:hypothetical protein
MATSAVGKSDRTIGTRGDAQEQEQGDQYRWIILLGLITAAIMAVLDTTIINVALPQMAGNLGATIQEIAWVSTGHPVERRRAADDRVLHGHVRTQELPHGFDHPFVTASFLCGTSHSLGELILWRVVRAREARRFRPRRRRCARSSARRAGHGAAIFILGIIVAPTLGPTLGGWITDNYNWGWCFFINVPIGIVATFLVTGFLHDPPGMRKKPQSIDWAGISLLTIGLAALQYVLEEGREKDWFNDTLIRLSVVAGCRWRECCGGISPGTFSGSTSTCSESRLAGSIFLFIALGFDYGAPLPAVHAEPAALPPTETGSRSCRAASPRPWRSWDSAQRRQTVLRWDRSTLVCVVRRRDVALGHLTGTPESPKRDTLIGQWTRDPVRADQSAWLPNLRPFGAGIRVDQPGAPRRAAVRDRDHHDVSDHRSHAPGDTDREHVYRESAAVARQNAASPGCGLQRLQAKQGWRSLDASIAGDAATTTPDADPRDLPVAPAVLIEEAQGHAPAPAGPVLVTDDRPGGRAEPRSGNRMSDAFRVRLSAPITRQHLPTRTPTDERGGASVRGAVC